MLTTLADVKTWLGISNTNDDAQLTRLITAASTFIESWSNRVFGSASYTEIRNGNGKDSMVLKNAAITAVASISINGLPIPVSTGFGVNGYSFDGTSIYLTGYRFDRGSRNVEVHYTAGYVVIPNDIQQVCIDLVALRYKERDRIGHRSKGLANETVTFFIEELSPFARSTLNQYRAVVQP